MPTFQRFTSIRAKLGAAIIVAVGVTILVMYVLLAFTLPGSVVVHGPVTGIWHDTREFLREAWWLLLIAGGLAAGAALVFVRLLARGMTKPLRDMAAATSKMARGDYTERVHTGSRDEVGKLAVAFNQMAGELERVERLRRDLVANVSHELKTPIAAIRAHLENLLEGVERPDRQTLEVMLRQSERLSSLVEQVLDLARLESGAMPMTIEPVALGSLAGQVVAEIAIARPDRGTEVRNEIPPDFPVAQGDRQRIHQVLYNLLDNAVRFTPAGGSVVVSAHAQGHELCVTVEDAGPGIPEAQIPFVFERFYRADASRSRADGGAGLGLAIARSIVEAHGGRIWAERREPQGMRFSFSLPAGSLGPRGEPEKLAVRSGAVTVLKEDV